MGIFFRVVI